MIVLGIDPGSYTTGFAVIEKKDHFVGSLKGQDSAFTVLKYGAICCKRTDEPADRLVHIVEELETIIQKYKPDFLSMEGAFFAKNAKTALMLGQVRGAVLVTCRRLGLKYAEYSPRSVKQAVTGNGGASKEQVASMIGKILHLEHLDGPLDASDALAIAWTHASPPPIFSMLPKTAGRRKNSNEALRELALKLGAISE